MTQRHWGHLAGLTWECMRKDHAGCHPANCGPDTYPLHWMTVEEVRTLLELTDHLRGYHKPGVKRPKTGPTEPDQPEPEYVPEPGDPEPESESKPDVKPLTPEQMKLLEQLTGEEARQAKSEKLPWHKPEHATPDAAHTPDVALEERPNGRGGFQRLHVPTCSCGWGTELGYRSFGAATAAVNAHIRLAELHPNKEVKS